MKFNAFRRWLGIPNASASRLERLLSALGGFLGVLGVITVTRTLFEGPAATLVITSAGASSVLVFAVPHGTMSQPWAVLGGHGCSAIVGVTCATLLGPTLLTGPIAVGLAIFSMYSMRCLHPPGGATALTAVIGGPQILDLGYAFVVLPVLLNMTIVVLVGLVFNLPISQRQYPSRVQIGAKRKQLPRARHEIIDPALLSEALSEFDTFIDVSEQDLMRIFAMATREPSMDKDPNLTIELGASYSNGQYSHAWQIRQVLAIEFDASEQTDMVRFRVVAGAGRRHYGRGRLESFQNWANHRVYREDCCWRPLYSSEHAVAKRNGPPSLAETST